MRFLLSLALLTFLYTPAQSQALTGDQIKTMFFNGKPFVATSTTRQRYTMVFTPDGKASREPLKKAGESAEKTVGTWKVVKEGFCTSWKQGSPATCYRLVPNTMDDTKWSVMKGAVTVASWTKPAE
ncbi:hypothetical protein [Pseudorhodoplanes sp.]|jgi:hypothetical protein|uniref:hypothetical protein n=1 Tax=Pseudorhodoplanes sp. TaxID=1934341 RepID=UPI002C1AF3D8|nr:hypothetical protein [Pseudorhodoplanes sp.]HWV42439.1 hypothetical protein [Pseudorhodoplanes sp.]